MDYTLRLVITGSALLGAVCGALGVFAVLRRQSLLGDAVAHAALPGLVLAFMLTRSTEPWVLLAGACITGSLAAFIVFRVSRHPSVRFDSALATALAVFFGIGLLLLTLVQRSPGAQQAGLDRFLFGQAAAMLREDVVAVALLGGAALLLLVLFWRPISLVSFDPGFAATVGTPVRRTDLLLNVLLIAAIVTGLQSVGVVLVSALVVAPAVAARQWTHRLGPLVLLAAVIGAVSGAAGAAVSATAERVPTGPAIVLVATILVAVSLLRPRRVAAQGVAP